MYLYNVIKTNIMIKKKDGFRYSLKPFNGYKYRVKFVAEDKNGSQKINTDVYTDNENREVVTDLLNISAKKKELYTNRYYTGVVNWTTKEQDDKTAEFLEETLKNI